jgi:hypothetical protein
VVPATVYSLFAVTFSLDTLASDTPSLPQPLSRLFDAADAAALRAMTDAMPVRPETARDFTRRMRDEDRY